MSKKEERRKMWLARSNALFEAASHISDAIWTDDKLELAESKYAAAQIEKLAEKAFRKTH